MTKEEDPSGKEEGVELLGHKALSSSMSPMFSMCFLGLGPCKGPTEGTGGRTVIEVGLRQDTTKEASENGLQWAGGRLG